MDAAVDEGTGDAWDTAECEALIAQLWTLRSAMLEVARQLAPLLARVDAAHATGAANLAHYLAMRRTDLRPLQERLARLGLSSLGRAETHALANLDKVIGILHRLVGRPWSALTKDEPVGSREGPAPARLLMARRSSS